MEEKFERLLEIYSKQLGFELDEYHITKMRDCLETYDLLKQVENHLK